MITNAQAQDEPCSPFAFNTAGAEICGSSAFDSPFIGSLTPSTSVADPAGCTYSGGAPPVTPNAGGAPDLWVQLVFPVAGDFQFIIDDLDGTCGITCVDNLNFAIYGSSTGDCGNLDILYDCGGDNNGFLPAQSWTLEFYNFGAGDAAWIRFWEGDGQDIQLEGMELRNISGNDPSGANGPIPLETAVGSYCNLYLDSDVDCDAASGLGGLLTPGDPGNASCVSFLNRTMHYSFTHTGGEFFFSVENLNCGGGLWSDNADVNLVSSDCNTHITSTCGDGGRPPVVYLDNLAAGDYIIVVDFPNIGTPDCTWDVSTNVTVAPQCPDPFNVAISRTTTCDGDDLILSTDATILGFDYTIQWQEDPENDGTFTNIGGATSNVHTQTVTHTGTSTCASETQAFRAEVTCVDPTQTFLNGTTTLSPIGGVTNSDGGDNELNAGILGYDDIQYAFDFNSLPTGAIITNWQVDANITSVHDENLPPFFGVDIDDSWNCIAEIGLQVTGPNFLTALYFPAAGNYSGDDSCGNPNNDVVDNISFLPANADNGTTSSDGLGSNAPGIWYVLVADEFDGFTTNPDHIINSLTITVDYSYPPTVVNTYDLTVDVYPVPVSGTDFTVTDLVCDP